MRVEPKNPTAEAMDCQDFSYLALEEGTYHFRSKALVEGL